MGLQVVFGFGIGRGEFASDERSKQGQVLLFHPTASRESTPKHTLEWITSRHESPPGGFVAGGSGPRLSGGGSGWRLEGNEFVDGGRAHAKLLADVIQRPVQKTLPVNYGKPVCLRRTPFGPQHHG